MSHDRISLTWESTDAIQSSYPVSNRLVPSYLVTTVRQDGYPLLSERNVFDVSKVFLASLLYGGQEQKAITVRREYRMRLGIQPLSLRSPFRVGLLALPRGSPTAGYDR